MENCKLSVEIEAELACMFSNSEDIFSDPDYKEQSSDAISDY